MNIMGIEDFELKFASLENLMPQKDVELEDGTKYRVYLEENVRGTDRCFGVSSTDNPNDIKLFQITTDMANNKDYSKLNLSKLDIEDDNTVKHILKNTLDIVNNTKENIGNQEIKIKDLSKTIAIKETNYILTYQPSTTGIVNMRKQYEEKVTRRIYGNY